MKDKYHALNDEFNLPSTTGPAIEAEVTKFKKTVDEIKSSGIDIGKDYDYTRGNLYSLIEKGQEALNSVLELAQETDSPRAYEVVGQILKSVSDTTDKLADLHKKMKDLDEDKSGPKNVTNALFVGSTSELSKLLKQQTDNNKKI